MAPLYTLLLCLPAALVLVACVCGLAALWSPAAQPTDRPTVGRQRGRRSAAGGGTDVHISRVQGALPSDVCALGKTQS
jgi:hypothetical protein